MTRRSAAGFTLVEVLVALLIFGMIAAAGTALLAVSVRAQGTTGAALDDLGDLNRLSAILTADLAQAQDRPARDRTGTLLPAFTGGNGTTPLLRLVRGGWTNVDEAARPTLQKVEYRLENGALERVGYPALDGAAPLPSVLLVDRVAGVALRFRYLGAWSDRWDGAGDAALPQAAELTLTREGGRAYRLLFLVGTGTPPPRVPAVVAPGPPTGGAPPPQRTAGALALAPRPA